MGRHRRKADHFIGDTPCFIVKLGLVLVLFQIHAAMGQEGYLGRGHHGRGDQEVMAGAGASSGATAVCPPPGMASESRELISELEDCASRVEEPTSKASAKTDFLVFTIRNPL